MNMWRISDEFLLGYLLGMVTGVFLFILVI
jgi:hypothetical protein|nr:MAG TPA_asm: hypothetical protein [Bacteriophage sp.]DAL16540.1 MAG TPA_asm: hypothetical protein [Caudoviricetes sp.]